MVYSIFCELFVDAECVVLLRCVVSCMKKSSLKTLCLWGMEGVPQCCEVFDCLRSSVMEEFQFEVKCITSLPVSMMTIYRIISSPLSDPYDQSNPFDY